MYKSLPVLHRNLARRMIRGRQGSERGIPFAEGLSRIHRIRLLGPWRFLLPEKFETTSGPLCRRAAHGVCVPRLSRGRLSIVGKCSQRLKMTARDGRATN